MFGLTKREQRWKAEQEAAALLAGMAVAKLRAVADIRVAEANANAAEIDRLRIENSELKRIIAAQSPNAALSGSDAAGGRSA